MPTLMDRATGEVREVIDYNKNEGDIDPQELAQQKIDADPTLMIANDAMYRSNKTWEDGSMSQNPSGLTSNPYNEDSNPISNDEVKADY